MGEEKDKTSIKAAFSYQAIAIFIGNKKMVFFFSKNEKDYN